MNTVKTARILPVNFPKNAAILRESENGSRVEPAHTRYGWDIRRDTVKGTRSDTGKAMKNSSNEACDTGRNAQAPTRETPWLYAHEMDKYGNFDQSLLPPVASL